MQRLLLVGLSHATAPLAVREKCAFTPQQREAALADLRQKFPEAEAVLVSTCNRVELYVARPVHGRPKTEEMVQFISEFHGIAESELRPHLYDYSKREVVDHLFAVTASLDSLVVGETQILSQVREAYEASKTLGLAGNVLHPMFQRAIAAAREAVTETRLAEGRRSVASIAVDYARQIFESFSDKTVLSIGAGKMSTLVLKHLSDLHIRKLVVLNRDITKAQALAEQFGGTAASTDAMVEHLAEADIVVTGTASPMPIITAEIFQQVMKKRRWRPSFLIDIALPRDVEEAVGKLDNVYLYNIDDLQQVASATDSARAEAVQHARKIVQDHVEEFIAWNRARELGPLIEQLFAKSHAMAQDEVIRTINKLPDMSEPEKQHLSELARRIVNKLLHNPVQAVREADAEGATPYMRALVKLFKL